MRFKKGNKNIISFIILVFISLIWIVSYMPALEALAADTTEFTPEEYTNDDRLLDTDGSLSNKTITVFANEVKNAIVGITYFPELAEVFPRQYLD